MQYLLMIYGDETAQQSAPKEKVEEIMGAYTAYTEALAKAGAMVAGARLKPSHTATSVRARGGKTEVLDGPYAETKERLCGYYLIEVPDMDAALSWAARCPGATTGTVEVRPIWPLGGAA